MRPAHAIETEDPTKFYGEHRGIEDVTIAVEAARCSAFSGPTAPARRRRSARRSTCCAPTRGSARILGLDSHRDSVAIRARLGNLPGDFGYEGHTTGRQALSLIAGIRGVGGLGRAEQLAGRFRADLDRPMGQLSRGNRQKVGLILATFHEPELLILDEPTSGLDPLMQEEFLALVREECERGCTVFISSHELDEVQRVCDRVGMIRDGRVITVERVSELLDKTPHRDMLGDPSPAVLLLIECTAPGDVLLDRARRRGSEPDRVSDAGERIVRRQLDELEPAREWEAPRLELATEAFPDHLAAEVEAFVDRSLWRERGAPRRNRSR
jgi:ABC-2 type transport system ATP-binding protein